MTFLKGSYCTFAALSHCWLWTWGWSWVIMNQRYPLCHVTKQLLFCYLQSLGWAHSLCHPHGGFTGLNLCQPKFPEEKGSWGWALAVSQWCVGSKTWKKWGQAYMDKVRPGPLLQAPKSTVWNDALVYGRQIACMLVWPLSVTQNRHH